MKTFILKENSKEIRQKIKDSGIPLCVCAEFVDSDWLDNSTSLYEKSVHGSGYLYEGMTKEASRALFLQEVKNPIWCENVDEFIRLIKEFENGNKTK